MNLEDYVKIYDDFLDEKFCKKIIRKSKKFEWKKHNYSDPRTNESISYEDDLLVSHDTETEEMQIINQKIWFAIKHYIEVDHKHMEWYSSWNGYITIRLNRYDVNTKMRTHCDHIHTLFDGQRKGIPTLTILGALNDNYEGGELIMWESKKIELKAGQLMIFPSNFLYPHRVDPITKGTRYSYVSWVW